MGSILPAQLGNYDSQTGAKGGGQFKPKSGGQTHRNFHFRKEQKKYPIDKIFTINQKQDTGFTGHLEIWKKN